MLIQFRMSLRFPTRFIVIDINRSFAHKIIVANTTTFLMIRLGLLSMACLHGISIERGKANIVRIFSMVRGL